MVDDRISTVVHRQDETSGVMQMNQAIWDNGNGEHLWNWISANGSGASPTTRMTLSKSGQLTVSGELEAASLDINGNADVSATLYANAFQGGGSYHEFGNDTANVSNDGSWNGRLNVAGTAHARIDARQSTGDGIITTMYSHNGHAAGKLGTMSNHPVHLMVAGTTRATLDSGSNFAVTGELEGGSLDINGNADITGNITNATWDGDVIPAGKIATLNQSTSGTAAGLSEIIATDKIPEYILNKHIYQSGTGGFYMPMVKGGILTGGASTVTGRLRIKIPHYKAAAMQSFVIDIYEYNTERMQSIHVGGYSYTDTNAGWYNTSAIALMDSDNRDLSVRFGADTSASAQYVAVGETNTTWTYPQVVVRNYMSGHSTQSGEMLNSFTIEFVTTDGATYVVTHDNNQPYANWSKIEGKPSTFAPTVGTASNEAMAGNTVIPSGNQIIDWSASGAGTIHTSNYIENVVQTTVSGSSGSCTGNAATASVATSTNTTKITAAGTGTYYPTFVNGTSTASYESHVDSGWTFNQADKTMSVDRVTTATSTIRENNSNRAEGGVTGLPLMSLRGQGAGNAANISLHLAGDSTSSNVVKMRMTAVNGDDNLVGAGHLSYFATDDTFGIGQNTSHNQMAILIDNDDVVSMKKQTTFTNGIDVTSAIQSTSKTTGTVKIAGGVGIVKTLNVGEDVVAYASSDERYKDNLKPITNPIDKVKSLTGYTFTWNDKHEQFNGNDDIGVVAQEVEKVLPEIVDTRDNGYKAVKYEKMVALLIEAVKEQQNQIDDLKKIIDGYSK